MLRSRSVLLAKGDHPSKSSTKRTAAEGLGRRMQGGSEHTPTHAAGSTFGSQHALKCMDVLAHSLESSERKPCSLPCTLMRRPTQTNPRTPTDANTRGRAHIRPPARSQTTHVSRQPTLSRTPKEGPNAAPKGTNPLTNGLDGAVSGVIGVPESIYIWIFWKVLDFIVTRVTFSCSFTFSELLCY